MKYQRQLEILQYINEQKSVTIDNLLAKFDISRATLNRDLLELEKNNSIKKLHGGVMSNSESLVSDFSIDQKELLHREEKIKIAKHAVSLVHDNQTILLDTGSTIWYFATELAKQTELKGVTVVTHDLKVAWTLCENPNISLYVLGGTRQEDSYDLFDPYIFKILDSLNVDTYFMGVSAFDCERGLTHFLQDDVFIKEAMMRNSKKIVLCTDSSKYGVVKRWKLCNLNDIDTIITDDKLDNESIEILKANSNELIIVK